MEDKILHFFLFCIYAVAEKHNKTSAYIYELFKKYEVSSYIIDCYEALHTQGELYIIDDLEEFIVSRGGKIA
ncbi:MAG: DUF3791 domain-containing protein [Oscillospiraceae bacterium]|nr:DUF3791 domain-containing protein [Oscillospiraceae bacterium]